MHGFRKFVLRGTLVDLAVAVVVGVAFNAAVHALIQDLVTPLIAAVGGQPNFAGLSFRFHNSTFHYGDFINSMLSFLVLAATVYYLVVLPTDHLAAISESREEALYRSCPECLGTIPVAAKRCMFCTSEVPPAPVPEQHPAPAAGTILRDRLRDLGTRTPGPWGGPADPDS
ncbi:MAG TPA: large conductance mechanosensitive channel protein MscL [Streptosporangiaceae bacterium]|nr:large conductance mechanosensitive channel protein MscL [Streptosporangiaceae bacterium]